MADSHAGESGIHHETSDVDIRAIFGSAIALAAVIAVVSVIVWVMFRYFTARESAQVVPLYPLATEQEQRLPPEPRLQTDPRQDLLDLRAEEDRTLTTYGWVNQSAGVVRIPIEEAMKLTLKRGLPARRAESHK